MKVCVACGVTKPLGEFSPQHRKCRPCGAEASRQYAQRQRDGDPLWDRRRHLRKFGISLTEFHAILDNQGGKCAICGAEENQGGRSLAVDHDPSCCPGKTSCGRCVRGLLCGRCNMGLGQVRDSPETLRAAAAYLQSNRRPALLAA